MLYFKYALIFGVLISVSSSQVNDFEFKISFVHDLIRTKGWNCTDVIEYFQKRIYKYNPIINAVINVNPKAMSEAFLIDQEFYANGKKLIGKLHCIPVLVKDVIDVKGLPTTGGLYALRYSIPNKDSKVVEKLKAEGAIMIAKANLGELALGNYMSELGGSCRNPWNLKRSCGTTSSGSGAGIAAGMGIIGLGTDTMGSIIIPASFCGVYGIRPVPGLTDLHGIIPNFSTSDTVGPMTKCLEDLILSYNIMTNSTHTLVQDEQALKKLKIGYIEKFWTSFEVEILSINTSYKIDRHVDKALKETLLVLKNANINVININIEENEFRSIWGAYESILYSHLIDNCKNNCFKDLADPYFADSERFQSDSPYHSFDEFAKSPLLTELWSQRFSKINSSICASTCEAHHQAEKNITSIVTSWFLNNNLDILLFPALNEIAYILNDYGDTEVDSFSPIFIPVHSHYPVVVFPIGFSTDKFNDTSDNLPISMMAMSKKHEIQKAFQVAKLYEKLKPVTTDIPKNTPLIKTKKLILRTNASNSYHQEFKSIFLLIFLNFVFLKKCFL